jgi:hypothetical protein
MRANIVGATKIDHQYQRPDGSLPFRCVMLALQQLCDIGGGVMQSRW